MSNYKTGHSTGHFRPRALTIEEWNAATRTCTECGKTKDTTEFSTNRPRRCNECIRLKRARLRIKYIDKEREMSKSRYAKNRELYHEKHILNKYGLTEKDFLSMLSNQDNKCLICGTSVLSFGKKTHVDHDHKTGRVRGILCGHCNRGLGHFNDSVELLGAAIRYLQ